MGELNSKDLWSLGKLESVFDELSILCYENKWDEFLSLFFTISTNNITRIYRMDSCDLKDYFMEVDSWACDHINDIELKRRRHNQPLNLIRPHYRYCVEYTLNYLKVLLDIDPKNFQPAFLSLPVDYYDKIDDLRDYSRKVTESNHYKRLTNKAKVLSYISIGAPKKNKYKKW